MVDECDNEFRHAFDVEANPSKAFRVIQSQAARIAALEAQLAELAAENERLKRVNNGLHDEVQFMRQAVKENREALSRTGAVKALEWTELSTGWIAHTSFHAYEVVKTDQGFMATYANRDFAWGAEDAMKVAAQADYERRILSALEATPPAPKVTEAMVEAGHAAMMSELFLVCQPDRGDVFSFMDDHPEIIQIALTAAQEAGKP